MFSDSEQKHLNSFLNYLEKLDAEEPPQKEEPPKSSVSNSSSSSSNSKRKSSDKGKATPYERKETTKWKRARKLPHELLSEDQKKANHIASEQKRRANIRLGFDQLVDIVPGLDTYHRSEAYILQKSVEYIRELLDDKNELKERARELQLILGTEPDEDSSEGELDFS